MYDALLILASLLVGIPGATWLFLQVRAAQKREQTAYDWSVAEIARRTKLLEEKEAAAAEIKPAIGRLMQDVARLRAEHGRLEAIIEQSGITNDPGQQHQRA